MRDDKVAFMFVRENKFADLVGYVFPQGTTLGRKYRFITDVIADNRQIGDQLHIGVNKSFKIKIKKFRISVTLLVLAVKHFLLDIALVMSRQAVEIA